MKTIYFFAAWVMITGLCHLSAEASPCSEVFSQAAVMKPVPHVIVLSAPSGGGKTTLAGLLVKDFPNMDISISSTTRAPRGTEKDGVDYHFLSVADFKAKIASGKFAEWAEVHGNFYGTDVDNIEKSIENGHSVLSLIDVNGAQALRKIMPDKVYTIFIRPPDMQTLETRLRDRGTDSEEAVQRRLKNAQVELASAASFDKVIVNDVLDRARQEIASLFVRLNLVPN